MKCILVVDDEPVIQSLVAASLASRECRVVFAADGPTALRSARESRPDLILLDLGLPGMNGVEVARKLKVDRSTAHIPILYLTGREPESCAPAEGVILKPFTPATLRASTAGWL